MINLLHGEAGRMLKYGLCTGSAALLFGCGSGRETGPM